MVYYVAMNLDSRGRYLLVTAIFEWIEAEKVKPSRDQRTSDMTELTEMLEDHFPGDLRLAKAEQDAKKIHLAKLSSEEANRVLKRHDS